MDVEYLRDLVQDMNNATLAGMQSGQDIARREAQAEITRLRADCITMALRLYGESPDTFSPETRECMNRWRPEVEDLLHGRKVRA